MTIVAYNAGHDGRAVLLQDGKPESSLLTVVLLPLCTNDSGTAPAAAIDGLKVASSR